MVGELIKSSRNKQSLFYGLIKTQQRNDFFKQAVSCDDHGIGVLSGKSQQFQIIAVVDIGRGAKEPAGKGTEGCGLFPSAMIHDLG